MSRLARNPINIPEDIKVSMKDNTYLFTKKHEGKKEIYLDTYVKSFIEQNMDINKIKDNID